MAEDRLTLKVAEELLAGLEQPEAPTTCPICLWCMGQYLFDDEPRVVLLRTKCHAFYDVLFAFLLRPWTPRQRESVSDALRTAHSCCGRCNPEKKTLAEVGRTRPAIDEAHDGISLILAVSLADQMVLRHEKGFGSKRGRWPTSVEQVFPVGPERTVDTLVKLFEAGIAVEPLISSVLAVHRPLAFPALLAHGTRARMISAIVARLNAVELAISADIARIRAPVLPAVSDAIAQRHLRGCAFLIVMLDAIAFGLDVRDDDVAAFARGHETRLFTAVDKVLEALERPERSQENLSRFAFLLWNHIPRAQCPLKPRYILRIEAQTADEIQDPYIVLYYAVHYGKPD